jgi:hypothetical protein
MTIFRKQQNPFCTADDMAKFPPTGVDAMTVENLAGSSLWKITLRDGSLTVVHHYNGTDLHTPAFAEWLREKTYSIGHLRHVLTQANVKIGGRVRT